MVHFIPHTSLPFSLQNRPTVPAEYLPTSQVIGTLSIGLQSPVHHILLASPTLLAGYPGTSVVSSPPLIRWADKMHQLHIGTVPEALSEPPTG